ncbi:MAG: endopeptidase La [Bacteroidetes bacterium]|nr:endopeptidase La [Bacteroidota bacterium]
MVDDDVEMIPLLTVNEDEEDQDGKEEFNSTLPILPIRNNVLFPGVVIPISVGRDSSIKAVRTAYKGDKIIGVIAQKDVETEDPEFEDLQSIGTVAKIVKMLKMPDGGTTLIIQGKRRFVLKSIIKQEPYLVGEIETLEEVNSAPKKEMKAFMASMKEQAAKIIELSPNIPEEAKVVLKNINGTVFLTHFIASNLNIDLSQKQELLELADLRERAQKVTNYLNQELQILELKNQIQSKVRGDMEKQQRDYFLNQQMKQIQQELGGDVYQQEIERLKEKAKGKKWSKEVRKAYDKEIDKLQRINPAAAEYSVILNYCDLLLELPWGEFSSDKFDLNRAKKVLDKDHYGLHKVKDRILEYLAVLKLKGDMKSPILCLVGPPGVGKTSLGRSIAKSLNRKYVRMSLGGLHDESEIRGHRKTYIGAMPGRIVQSIKKVQSSNPVFILDEIDKVGKDFRGDPSSALLEVLDPEQNHAFYDNYLELEYDLSKVLFIATANDIGKIQPALRDRMEIIRLSGYSVEEKKEIARRHLVKKQRDAHGLKAGEVKLGLRSLEHLIQNYTRESGVRELDRIIASVMRSVAKSVAMEEKYDITVKPESIEGMLGRPRYQNEIYSEKSPPGVSVGLAWTPVGGDILFIESSISPGKGQLTLTGNLGDVMKESATTAMTYLKSNAEKIGVDPKVFNEWNVHIHVPEGAIPKDGPSAGIAMLSALTSLFMQRKVRPFLAMTGEITLRGRVLPVGGIKEKILAAKRAGIKEIILCQQNERDIEEINKEFIKDMKFHYVTNMLDVLMLALEKNKARNSIDVCVA